MNPLQRLKLIKTVVGNRRLLVQAIPEEIIISFTEESKELKELDSCLARSRAALDYLAKNGEPETNNNNNN